MEIESGKASEDSAPVHIALIVDQARLASEHPMLNRLSVGLMGEGAALTRIVPEGSDMEARLERDMALATRLEYPSRIVPWMRRARVQRLVDRLEKQEPDLIFASGHDTWALAQELAAEVECPLVIDIWSGALVRQVSRLRASAMEWCFAAATEALGSLLERLVPEEHVATVPLGVAMPDAPTSTFAMRNDAICFAVLGKARDARPYRAMFTALAPIMAEFPQIHVILELAGPAEHEVWRLVRRLKIGDRVSPITDAGVHHDLLSQADAAIVPDPAHEARTIILEVMASGVPVVARQDSVLDFLIPDRTAMLVAGAASTDWVEPLRRLLMQTESCQAIALEGRRWVEQHHRSSRQAELLHRFFSQVVTEGPFRFVDAPL